LFELKVEAEIYIISLVTGLKLRCKIH